jgi:tRNA(fMet)-specific endonuclease VapC
VAELRYLLDTNTCIFIIKHRPQSVRARFAALRPGEVAISAVTQAELFHGAYKSVQIDQNLAAVADFSAQMQVIAFGDVVTDHYGRLRATLERAGTPIGPLDFQIAATALAYGLTVVTNNVREFRRVSNLVVEDWTT